MKKRLGLALVSVWTMISLVACSASPANQTAQTPQQPAPQPGVEQTAEQDNTPQPGGVLRFARNHDITSFDPIIPATNLAIWTMLNMYDQLVRLSPNGDGIEPGVATDWTISEDGKTYVFNLRDDVKFHNGMPLTPEDVKYSLDRARGGDSNWDWIYPAIKSIDVTGEHQVTINLEAPYLPLLSTLALSSSSIVPKQVVEEKGKEFFANNPVGSGPFQLESWQRGQKIVLKKNPDYWQKGKPYLDGVEFVQVPEDTAKIFMLQAKELEISSNVPFSSLQQLEADPSLNVLVAPFARLDMIPINSTVEPFNDLKIRQAMNYAINKQEIIDAVLMGHGEVATSYLPKVMYYNEQLEGYPYNLEKAKQLMAESSRPDGFKATLTINSGSDINSQMAVIVKEQLKAIGIDLEIQQLEPGVVDEMHSSMKYEMITTYYSSDIIDPDEITMFGAAPSGGTSAYYTGYKNEALDKLALQAQQEQDETKRKEMYYELQRIFSEDAPFIFLFHTPNSYVTQKNVHGFQVSNMGSYRLEDVWLSKQ